jgi:hypothetical protein
MVVPIIEVFGARIVVLGVVSTKPSATKLLRNQGKERRGAHDKRGHDGGQAAARTKVA